VKQLSRAPLLFVALAVLSCTSSTPVPGEEPTATGEKSAATEARETTATAGDDSRVKPNPTVLADFEDRVDGYVSIRKKADDHTPPLKKTDEPGDIKVAQDALAQRIRDLNRTAKHGDIFTPEISADLKRLLRPEVTDKGTKEAIKDDNPESVPYLKVNAVYPENEPLSTVPPNVLMTLPTLPKDIEYRFVGKHMILRDARANLIIDYIPNAMP
jgi:hypothetical protein